MSLPIGFFVKRGKGLKLIISHDKKILVMSLKLVLLIPSNTTFQL